MATSEARGLEEETDPPFVSSEAKTLEEESCLPIGSIEEPCSEIASSQARGFEKEICSTMASREACVVELRESYTAIQKGDIRAESNIFCFFHRHFIEEKKLGI